MTAEMQAADSRSEAPLAGVRVLDLTRVIAGPYCTMMLADLGADVVKVEEPTRGDETRWVGRYRGRSSTDEDYFYALNRSKRSVALDLKQDVDRAVAHALCERADVLVENFSPGVAERLGMGWGALQARNQRLVYCSISGFGQTGPYRNRLALDPIIQAISGVMSVTGAPDGEPMQVGAPVADVVAGMFAASAILGALYSTKTTGRGRHIDISMQDSMVAVLGPRMGEALQAGDNPPRLGNENPMRVPANTYQTADDRYITVIVQNDNHWASFCRAIEREEWVQNAAYATMAERVRRREELNALVADRFRSLTAEEWVPRLERNRVPFALVNDYVGALTDPQVAHRGLIRILDHPVSGPIRVVGPPWCMTGGEARPKPPPRLGEHREEVLADWLPAHSSRATCTARSGRADPRGS